MKGKMIKLLAVVMSAFFIFMQDIRHGDSFITHIRLK